jgi:formylglycine-generating enzyme required for sulfatase activity
LGTSAFMAPEQVDDAKTADTRSDVFGLGATLYAVLTGRPPVKAQTLVEAFKEILTQDPDPPRSLRPEIPPALEAVILHAMQKDPDQRQQSAAELARELEDLSRGPRRVLMAVAAALVVVVAVAVGLALASREEPVGDRTVASEEVEEDPLREVTDEATDEAAGDPLLAAAPEWFRELPASERPRLPLPGGVEFGPRPNEYVNTKDDSILVWVAEGTARLPEREQVIAGFFVGKYEVTWAQWRVFCEETGHALHPRVASGFLVPEPDHPVALVSWEEARAYCDHYGLRLPTHLEFQLAAFGTDGRRFPWGDEEPGDLHGCFAETSSGLTASVTSSPRGASPSGCFHMVGNVKEWLADNAMGQRTRPDEGRVSCRGGSYANQSDIASWDSASTEMAWDELRELEQVGFRVARSAE